MPDTRIQVTLRTADAITENFVTNSWCVKGDGINSQTAVITTAFKDFYDDIVGFYPAAIAQNAHTVKFVALPGVQPNYPFAETTFNLASAPAGNQLPPEVALCLSFQGLRAAGFPQNRRRGRVYIGPMDVGTLDTTGLPTTATITTLATAAATLAATLQALTPEVFLAVWSTVDGAAVAIDNGWVDNAWDTQRRRGRDATTRTTWVA